MATTTSERRPSVVMTLVTLAVVVLVGLLALRWITGLILGLIQLVLVLAALYLIARVGWYLLRKGGTGS
ncbi:MAG: hypothetical protein AAGA93_27700 [Actinomycetota bacterium]